MRGLTDRVAIVTGAARGIGRASAWRFADEGARVVCADVDREGGEETVALIEDAGGEATFVAADVSEAAEVEAMVETAIDTYGRLDFAHNNAGRLGEMAAISDVEEPDWERVMAVNLRGTFLCMKHEIPRMRENESGGAIVNTASKAGLKPYPFNSAYAASKHGIVGATRAAAYEFAREDIRVNALCPGLTDTGVPWSEDDVRRMTSGIPMGRLGEPEEQGAVAVFLCSHDATYITAAAIPVDGGDLRKLTRESRPEAVREMLGTEPADLPRDRP